MNPSQLSSPHAATTQPHSSRWEPARWFLAVFGGLICVVIFSFFLDDNETGSFGVFLKGQTGFEALGTAWFWKLAVGFAVGAAAGYFAFLEIPRAHYQNANRLALALTLFFLPLLVYIPAMSADFIWDDDQEVSANSAILPVYLPHQQRFETHWQGLWEIWTGGITSDKDGEEARKELGKPGAPWLVRQLRTPLRWVERELFGGNDKAHYEFRSNQFADYFPVKTTMLWVEYQLWGYHLAPSGQPIADAPPFHIMNIFFHALDGLLLWMVLRQLKVPGAWFGSLLFVLHPVHAESVAWIAERKNTLSLFFCLLSMSAWLRFDDSGKRRDYLLSLGLFVAALLCKTHVVVFPAVLMLVTWWKTGKATLGDFARDLLQKAPFFAVALFLSLVTVWFQNDRAIGGEVIPIGDWWSRFAGAGVVIWSYLSKALLPINLNTIYANSAWLWWPLKDPQLWMFLAGALVPATLLLLLAIKELYPGRSPRASRTPFFVFAFFVGTLFPVLGFFTMSYMRLTLQADHFQYFSDISIVASAGAIAALLYNKTSGTARSAVVAVCVALVAVFSAYSWERAGVHQGEETLWRACLKRNEASWQAHNHIGAVLYSQRKITEAAPHFKRAVELKPENPEVHNNLGLVLWYFGHYDEAVAQYREAVRIKGEVQALRHNLADALLSLKRFGDSLEQYDIMIKDTPADPNLHAMKGAILAQMNRLPEARQELETALQIDPNNVAARQNMQILHKMGL
jgi:tetratricopeptide (TPR) repeat protein